MTDNYVLGRQFWGGDLEHQTEFATTLQKTMVTPGNRCDANEWTMELL